jgi:hypothetical protein
MRRLSLGFVLATLLLALMPFTLSGCLITCGCAATPDPNWTPPAMTAAEAATAVAKFGAATVLEQPTDLVASLMFPGSDSPQFEVSGADYDGIVDGHTGLVVEWISVGGLPDTTATTVSSAQAEATATTLLGSGNRDTSGMTPTTTLRAGTATSVYETTWSGVGFDAPGLSVLVNPATGAAFAFVDNRFGVQPALPTIAATAAGKLALAAVPTAGLAVQSAQFVFGKADPEWHVSVASAGPVGSDAPVHRALVFVDAVTGATTLGPTS